MKTIWLYLVLNGLTVVCHAWKPIVGQAQAKPAIPSPKATSAAFTSSFSLQQSHPEFSSKTGYASDNNVKEVQLPITDDLLTTTNSYKSFALGPAIPSSINFGDAKFGYKTAGYKEVGLHLQIIIVVD